MSLDDFLKDAWRDHGDDPKGVADRLQSSTHLIQSRQDVTPYATLVTHVFGEHLVQEQQGLALLGKMQTLPAYDPSAVVAGPLLRNMATLRYAQGDALALAGLSDEDRVCALAAASAMFLGRKDFNRAVQTMDAALVGAKREWPAQSGANRALAIAGNNLAAALEEKKDRTPRQTQAMLVAAQAGLTYWKLAGTWLEEERAEYRLASSWLQAGEPKPAIEAAQRCLSVCQHNDAPAFELFFAHAVLALAYRTGSDSTGFTASRAAALACFDKVPEEDRTWCKGELEELGWNLAA